MLRLRFSKTGNAVWISHLDLMRLFQRAFQRAGLPLKHSQGFRPRPMVSIALPLSVGVESVCELLDFELDGVTVPLDEVKNRLNRALVAGVEVLEVYEAQRKPKELTLLQCAVTLEYDRGVPTHCREAVAALFTRDSLPVEKKGKNGTQEQDILPLIRHLAVVEQEKALILEAVICAQNPALNPMLLVAAVERYLPEFRPDFARCRREAVFDSQEQQFQ